MLERKIGEVFYSQVLNKWVKVCEDSTPSTEILKEGCEKCAFISLACWTRKINPGGCAADEREDGKFVYFEETEEPQGGRPKMLARKIGEVFYSQVLGKWCKVCEDLYQSTIEMAGGCEECAFYHLDCVANDFDGGECVAYDREDGKYVHFEETEEPQKGGEQCQQ